LCDAYKKEGVHVWLAEEIKDKQGERSFEWDGVSKDKF
jgi:hypothetical protein